MRNYHNQTTLQVISVIAYHNIHVHTWGYLSVVSTTHVGLLATLNVDLKP